MNYTGCASGCLPLVIRFSDPRALNLHENESGAERTSGTAATGETPLQYMIRIMRDPQVEHPRRDEMAKAAAPYVHARFHDCIVRAHWGVARINARLCRIGGFDPDEWEFPPKPKWMRWRTYDRAEEKFDRYGAALNDGLMGAAIRLGFRP